MIQISGFVLRNGKVLSSDEIYAEALRVLGVSIETDDVVELTARLGALRRRLNHELWLQEKGLGVESQFAFVCFDGSGLTDEEVDRNILSFKQLDPIHYRLLSIDERMELFSETCHAIDIAIEERQTQIKLH